VTAITASGVTVEVGGRALLREVDLDVPTGTVHALLGPNGAGKSTLLSVLAGDRAPDRGTVEILGRPVSDWRLRELARERAVLTQEHSVAFAFPVREVVRMGRAPWARTAREDDDDRAVAAAIDAAELWRLEERAVPTLSGGERARTAFARTLAQESGILLLDEPTAALDLRHQEQTMQRARLIAARGGTVVVVVHDLTLAAAYADAVTLLSDGEVAATGSPLADMDVALLSDVYEHPVEFIRHPRTGAVIVQPIRNT